MSLFFFVFFSWSSSRWTISEFTQEDNMWRESSRCLFSSPLRSIRKRLCCFSTAFKIIFPTHWLARGEMSHQASAALHSAPPPPPCWPDTGPSNQPSRVDGCLLSTQEGAGQPSKVIWFHIRPAGGTVWKQSCSSCRGTSQWAVKMILKLHNCCSQLNNSTNTSLIIKKGMKESHFFVKCASEKHFVVSGLPPQHHFPHQLHLVNWCDSPLPPGPLWLNCTWSQFAASISDFESHHLNHLNHW